MAKEKDVLIVCREFFAGAPQLSANEACKWINGNTPEESRADRVVSITTLPYNEVYVTLVFYRSD